MLGCGSQGKEIWKGAGLSGDDTQQQTGTASYENMVSFEWPTNWCFQNQARARWRRRKAGEASGEEQEINKRSTSGIQAEYERSTSGARAIHTGPTPVHLLSSWLAPACSAARGRFRAPELPGEDSGERRQPHPSKCRVRAAGMRDETRRSETSGPRRRLGQLAPAHAVSKVNHHADYEPDDQPPPGGPRQ